MTEFDNYLNVYTVWATCARSSRYTDFSYHVLGTAGLNAYEKLSFQKVADNPGYAYVYVANESDANIDVFFDDFGITHKQSLVVSGNDYFPFGLPITDRSFDREGYRFDYQGQFSEKDDETGWNAFQLECTIRGRAGG